MRHRWTCIGALSVRYADEPFVHVHPYNPDDFSDDGFLSPTARNGTNHLDLMVFGNDEQVLIASPLRQPGQGCCDSRGTEPQPDARASRDGRAMSRRGERVTERADLEGRFGALKGANLNLDLTRGKPAGEQLDLADELDGCLGGDYAAEDGTDVRNYGMLRGLPEARVLGTRLLDVAPGEVIAGGSASLTLMFFVLDAAMNVGLTGTPWRNAGRVKCLCPVPGYDRHFTLADALGMELVTVPMTDAGPDMDVVEDLVGNDPDVRCIWCVPKYSNPTGCIYTEDTVRRLAELPGAARGERGASRSWYSGTTPTRFTT